MEIILDQLKFDETSEVHLLWSDESATLFTNFPYLATEDKCRERLVKMQNYYGQRSDHFGPFAIRSNSGEFLGLVGGDAGKISEEFDIWYFVRRDLWGNKIATTAVTHLLELMNISGRVQTVTATAVVDNLPSWRFLEKLGFHRVGLHPQAHKKDDLAWDLYVYSKPIR